MDKRTGQSIIVTIGDRTVAFRTMVKNGVEMAGSCKLAAAI